MYEPFEVLQSIDDHKWAIIALCAAAMAFNYMWFISAYRASRRDRVYSVPLFCTFFWLAGDSSFVFRYDTWFNTYEHWYVELFWVALVFTVLFELVYVGQAIRYGRDELLPSWSQGRFAALIVAGAAAAMLVWAFLKQGLEDELYITYFDVANVAFPLMAVGLLIRRRSSAGQTRLMWAGYTAMITCWFLASTLWFGPEFQSVERFALWGLCTVGGLGMLYAVSRMPAYVPPSPDRNGRPAAGAVPAPERVSAA